MISFYVKVCSNQWLLNVQYALYVHCRKIYNLFVQAFETGGKATLWRDFPVLCVYPAISKSPKQLPNCLKIHETSVVLIVFIGVNL